MSDKLDNTRMAGETVALEMKTECERCGVALRATDDVKICSHECTWCPSCAVTFNNICPNCGGDLHTRPKRKAIS